MVEVLKLWHKNIKIDLFENENIDMRLVDMLLMFVLQIAKKNYNIYCWI
jgi:hypothetical protein